MEILHLNEDSYKELMQKQGVAVVDFYATWCPPCKMLAPIMEEIAEEANGYTVAKLDIDQAINIANELGVMSIPTVIIFKDGQEQERLVGFRNKEELLDAINSIVK